MTIGRQLILRKDNFLSLFVALFTALMLLTQACGIVKFCFNADLESFRLNATIFKTTRASRWIECVMDCVKKPCCRSVNYKKTLISENEKNCEMSHDIVYTEEELEKNASYDYIYLTEPVKEYNTNCFPKRLWGNVKGKDCADLYSNGVKESGEYQIYPDGFSSFNVFCDMTVSGGGWIVFQRRVDGSVDFYRGWKDYKDGFGNLTGEFWLGLDKIHRLTNQSRNEIRIDMEDTSGNKAYAEYDYFSVTGEKQKYILNHGTYAGTAGDSLTKHKGLPFTTKDSDNDKWSNNCAVSFKGAWWYNACHDSNLNGQYLNGEHTSHADGINWKSWKGHKYSLKSTSMKIRPRAFGHNK